MLGLMEGNMKGSGKMENNMEKGSIYYWMVVLKQEYGKTERE